MMEKKCKLSLAWCESVGEINQRFLSGVCSSFPPAPVLPHIHPYPYANNSPISLQPRLLSLSAMCRYSCDLGCPHWNVPRTPKSQGSKSELIAALNLLQDHVAGLSFLHVVIEAGHFLDIFLSLLPPPNQSPHLESSPPLKPLSWNRLSLPFLKPLCQLLLGSSSALVHPL